MKTILLATSFLGLVGCTDEADIGTDMQPVTCMQTSAADMNGSVTYMGTDWHFDNALPTLVRDPSGTYTTISLWSSQDPDTQRGNYLRFTFGCGPVELADYSVVRPGPNQQPACPLQLSAAVLGSIEILPVDSGKVIIDETQGCVAGRFGVSMNNTAGDGSLSGWFSILQP